MFFRVFMVCCLAWVTAGCIEKKGADSDYYSVQLRTYDKFDQNTTVFTQGENIRIELKIINISDEPRTLHFPTTQQYDFVLKDVSGAEVWRWSDSQSFSAVVSFYSLESNETREINYLWNQRINQLGKLLPVGRYNLEADSLGINMPVIQTLDIK